MTIHLVSGGSISPLASEGDVIILWTSFRKFWWDWLAPDIRLVCYVNSINAIKTKFTNNLDWNMVLFFLVADDEDDVALQKNCLLYKNTKLIYKHASCHSYND